MILEHHAAKWLPEPNTGCFIWIGGLTGGPWPRPSAGYKGKIVTVTRVVCEEANGPPPTPKHQAAHNTPNGCIGGLCVNGGHLRWATNLENSADIPPALRSDRIKRGAVNIPIEVRRERSRRANLARWGD